MPNAQNHWFLLLGNKIWLWEEFKLPYESFNVENPIKELESKLTSNKVYWFIASDENGNKG